MRFTANAKEGAYSFVIKPSKYLRSLLAPYI